VEVVSDAEFQLPVESAEFARVGAKLYRKQILKLGKIAYGGQTLEFTPDYVKELVNSFNLGAFDQVAFQMADTSNAHTQDPERFRGEVKGLIPTESGLDALIELTEDGARVVEANPKLGVSARIVQPLKQADGRVFPRALHHVLGTLDPRLTGMAPWQPVQLSSDGSDRPVVDLTAAAYQGDPNMGDTPTPDPNATGTDTQTDPTDEELEAMLAALVAADASADPIGVAEPATAAALSAADRQAIEMRSAREQQHEIELAALRREIDEQKFEKERLELLSKGIPPKAIELAAPLLQGSGHVVELSAGGTADAGAIVRQILAEMEGQVDLTGEHGGNYPTNTQQATAAEDTLYQKLVAMTGGN
jgi:hypothetical protein